MVRHLYVIVSVVVKIQHAVQLAIHGDSQIFSVLDSFAECLSRVLFHLDIVKFPKIGEPFDKLCGVVLVELDVGEVHLEDGR